MTRYRCQPARPVVAAIDHRWPTTTVRIVLLALAVLAAGCGATSDNHTPQSQSPNAVHQAWVAAIQAGDGDTALALTDPELPERTQFAREAVGRMREYLTSPASPTGALEGVTVEPVADGVGRSMWQFAQKRWCYRTELISRAGRWYVSRWGQTSVACD